MKFNSKHDPKLPSPVYISIVLSGKGQAMCPNCELSFNDVGSLSLHLRLERNYESQCEKCLKVFTSVIGMKKHFGRKHVKIRPSRCRICFKRFRNKYALKFHVLQVHEKQSRQVCEMCLKDFYNKFSLARHRTVCKGLENRK